MNTKAERNEFQKLLKLLKHGDTLIDTKLDRFTRSTIDRQKGWYIYYYIFKKL
ncbi:recombinase family protein [Neobacillus pocheonensis]|uniref:Recombinase family protein n=1 Tax=Neobacillus pocheonensis TaxID=363869 RepID=A0ABT0WFE5_9BACI|nr:recombinase family protein [Neobacillus pocheonensis]